MTEILTPIAAAKLRQARQAEPDAYEPPGEPVPPRRPLAFIAASSFAGKEIPPRPWLVRDMIPDRTVTMLSGDGGVGKSLLALQLAVGVATSTDWIGTLPEGGTAIYVSAEDDLDEVHRRIAGIVAAQGLDLTDLGDLHILPLAGQEAVMGAPGQSGLVAATPLWTELAGAVADYRPRLLILDNLADVFGGNENSRPEARQFVGLLRRLAIDQGLAVLLLAHPSLSGLSSGTGTSGSTAWSNSVRSRLYFTKPTTEDGQPADDDLRALRVMKSNYGPRDIEIQLRWAQGRFRPETQPGGFDKIAAAAAADEVFMALLARFQAEERDVSASPSRTYAPAVFAQHPGGKGFSKKAFEAAMNRLFDQKKIRIEKFGPPSKQRSRIALAEEK